MKTRFGQVLHRLRIASGVSVRELARRIEMRASSVSQYENGLQTPSPAAVHRIGKVLEVPAELLLWFAFTERKAVGRKNSVLHQVDAVMVEQVDLFESAIADSLKQSGKSPN
jgi:transcriptional regulator with XRE-family HTH domain